ncbi:MAG: hypothetical protein ACE5E1_07415 [Phycisphaerae bacterium]
MNRRIVIVAVFAASGAALPATLRAEISGRIRRVGLFEGGAPLVRSGNWCFVEVELRCRDSKPFEGRIQLEQPDRDGDIDVFVQDVALAPDGKWRPYELYFIPNLASGGDRVRVQLFNHEDGRLVKMTTDIGEEVGELVSPPYSDLPSGAEQLLILDLSFPRKLPHAAVLDTRRVGAARDALNPRTVRSLAPQALPTRWLGLEPVDAIIWDDVDPSVLSQQQTDALIGWVEAGGRLLLTAGKNWQLLAKSPLARVLPVAITGVSQQNEVQAFTLDIVDNAAYRRKLDQWFLRHPISCCDLIRRPGATDVIGIPSEDTGSPRIAYRRLLGRGMLAFVGAPIRSLMPEPKRWADPSAEWHLSAEEREKLPEFVRMSEQIVGRLLLGLPKLRDEGSTSFGMSADPANLFSRVRDTIGFQTLSAAFLIFAVLFAIAYTLAATFGSYWYLKRRGWEHYAWNAFVLVSLAGIVIGTGMVWTLRGVRTRLWQTTVVDGRAGETHAYATSLFGVKTPDHTRLDLQLPVGDPPENEHATRQFGSLRVLPSLVFSELEESRYVAPYTYQTRRAGEDLRDVPVRATLKEFQGFWHGSLGGTIEARLVLHAGEKRFGEGSHIRNRLGVVLRNCYILQATQEIAGAGPGISDLSNCLYLGTLPKSGPDSELDAEQLARRLYYEAGDPPKLISPINLRLGAWVKAWRRDARRSITLGQAGRRPQPRPQAREEEAYAALLLLSVFDLLEEETGRGLPPFRRSFGRGLDCTHQLTRDTAILIGYSDERPPAVLQVDRTNLFPERARTMYRFVIPVERR